jgi:hypothetical protein
VHAGQRIRQVCCHPFANGVFKCRCHSRWLQYQLLRCGRNIFLVRRNNTSLLKPMVCMPARRSYKGAATLPGRDGTCG